MPGTLYVVGTPIGNLSDITLRALETLRAVDIIACENRNHHLKLLNHFEIKKRIIEVSPANEKNSAAGIVKLLQEGNDIALVSDAGTPGLSDPGGLVVDSVRLAGLPVIPIPGPSALASLFSVAGMPGKRILFLGFLSKKSGKLEKELTAWKDTDTDMTIILYVSPYQVKKVLESINKTLGNVEILVGREMTKAHEEYLRGPVEAILQHDFPEKGEFSLAVSIRKSRE